MLIRTILILFIYSSLNFSQILQWTPFFATDQDSIVIIYDATQGNGALASAGPPIYAHTGVITNLSTSPTDWRYVKTNWGVNTPETMLQFLGNSKWKISFRIRSYYGVPANEQILHLAFVFRNASSTVIGRDADGSDIYLPVSQPGLNVGFSQPFTFPVLKNLNDSIKVEAQSASSINLQLFVDGTLVSQTTSNVINYSFQANSYGKKWVKAVATGTGGTTKADSFYFVVREPVTVQSLPQGVVDGINYVSNTSVILSLYAPEKEFVYVIGDFNNWELDPSTYLKRTPDGKRYWIQINGLTPQTEYRYQYLVDNKIRIADPFTEKVLDPWNDKYIGPTTYPNLIQYPVGKTTQPVGILQTGMAGYPWQVTNFQKPAKTDLVIYELLLRDFVVNHDYKTLIDTLDYLQRLGVNAIELMPINEFEGNESWGYNPSFYFAPDKYYGPKDSLKKFIDAAHSRGIAVILDIVLNHSFGQSPLVRLYWDAVNNRPAANNPWYNQEAMHPYSVGYDFNHESQATKDFVDRVTKFWIQEYKVDGYRFDLSKGFTQTYSGGNVGLWGQYDQSRINILKRIADVIWSVDPSFYVILEHFADNSEETVLSNYGMMLWGNLNYAYNEATMGWNNNSDFSWISYKSRGWQAPNLIGYMESHDEERLMYKNYQYGNQSGSYNTRDTATALERMKLASAFFFTIPGPKMIWQFGEVGYDFSINYPCGTSACRTDKKPIRWDYKLQSKRDKLFKVYSALINLKKNYDVFRTTDYALSLSGATKRIQLNHSSMNVNIIGNFDVVSRSINPQFQNTGIWYDFFSGDSINVSDQNAMITLNAGEFHIYSTVKLPTPEAGIVTEIKNTDDNISEIKTFNLEQNYPNPFNPVTTIKFSVPVIETRYSVALRVYDVLGNEIVTLINSELPQGYYEIKWDAANYPSGIYFYRLTAGSFSETRKMILLR